jgi:trans-aconitate 2-methyltransferase
MTPPPRDWDAGTYDRVAAPMTQRGTELVDELDLRGDETVIDAGCGTGQVTARLLERLPDGHVIALDGSQAMLERARERFGEDPRVELLHHDLREPLPFDAELDAIVTTSTLHWVPDHPALFKRFAAALRPGGQLVAEFGGAGNIARVLEVIEAQGHDWSQWTYPTPGETMAALVDAGFEEVRAALQPRPEDIPPEQLEEYLRTVVLGTYVDRLAPEETDALVAAVLQRLDDHVIDYVRLNVVARRAFA